VKKSEPPRKSAESKKAKPTERGKSALKPGPVKPAPSARKSVETDKNIARNRRKSEAAKKDITTKKPASQPKRHPVQPAEGVQVTARAHPTYPSGELEYFKSIIIDKIWDASEELTSIEERLMDSSTGEFHDDDSTYSLHMADQGTDAMEREKAFLFAQRERKFISHLSDALQRIKSGNYGVCITCGNLIEKGRLEAVPHARMCVSCKNLTKSE